MTKEGTRFFSAGESASIDKSLHYESAVEEWFGILNFVGDIYGTAISLWQNFSIQNYKYMQLKRIKILSVFFYREKTL